MKQKNSLRKKLESLIPESKTISEIEYLLVSEIELKVFEYNSFFKGYFFAISSCLDDICKVKYSESISSVIGFSAEQIEKLPKRLNSIIHEDDRLRVETELSDFFSTKNSNDLEIPYRIVDAQNNIVHLTETIHAERDESGTIVKYYSIFHDTSKVEKEKSNIIADSKDVEKKNSIKDKFISIVSHDLKAPYTTLLGFSEILLNDNSLPEEEKREYLEYIHNSSQHQLNLIEHLLDWSRLRTGRTVIEEQRLNLKNIVSSVVSQLTGMAIRKNIDISQNVQNDVFIKSDEKQISKAITNLLTNAIHFSHPDSTVVIYGSRFNNGMIEIIVKDKGIGIPESEQEKLFKLDQKFTIEGTSGEQGNGMGLIVVKEIMDKLNGDVWFYSREGEGSEFHLTIPEAKNILLLVDENVTRMRKRAEFIAEALPSFSVLTASNGYQALDFIDEELPSIVITNDSFSLLSGEELLKRIRNKDKYFSVSVIVLTKEVTDDIEARFESFSIDGIYKENTTEEKLIKIVKQTLK